jgi:hypothetical protein
MPPSSKVITMLPPRIRYEVERRMFENGFRDFDGLAQWVRGEGYQISDDSLWRYGYKLKQQFVETKWTMLQTRTLSELGVGEQDMEKALMRIAQTKALATLADMEETSAADLNARTNLIKTIMTQCQRAAEFKARCEQQKQMAAGGTPGPAATAPGIPQNEPPAAPAAQQSQAAIVGTPVKSEQHDSPVVPKPHDEIAAQPPAGRTAVPAEGGPVAASGIAVPPLIENSYHHASPRNTAELRDSQSKAASHVGQAPRPGVLFAKADAEQGLPGDLRQPNICIAAGYNTKIAPDSVAAALIQTAAHPWMSAESHRSLARSRETSAPSVIIYDSLSHTAGAPTDLTALPRI